MTEEKKADPSRRAWPVFAFAVVVGLGMLAFFGVQAYRDIRITWYSKPATCSVISSSVATTTTKFSRVHRDDTTRTTLHPQVTYQLRVGDRWYTAVGLDNMKGWMSDPAEAEAFRPGQSYPCWYDPWNPERAVLKKHVHPSFYVGLLIPAFFLLIGGSMLSHALRHVPAVKLEGARAGEALAVRLSPDLTGRQTVGCVTAAALIWTAGVVVFFGYLINGKRLFDGSNLTTLALIATAIDAFIIYHLVRFVRALGIPELVVEISREPLRPGDSARLFIRQPGPAQFDVFNVSVLCEEQGKNGLRQSHRRQLINRKGVNIARGGDLSETVSIDIPADAPLSVKELQTIVSWKVVVHRKLKFGDADREFVFRVLR